MKTQEPHQPLTDDEDEVTLVAPRFDDEETIVARRVVPLEEVGRDAPAFAAARARPNSRPPLETRRPWLLALVFVSSLVGGGVLGGAGFYFYQRSAAARPVPAVVTEQSNAATQTQDSGTQTDESSAPATDDAKAEEHDAPDETDAGPAVEQRKASGDGTSAGAPKRGKKGEHDEEIQRNERRSNRAGPDGQLSRADTDASTSDRQARHVDTIFERPRRASRRAAARPDTSGDDADRLRRIFEGQP